MRETFVIIGYINKVTLSLRVQAIATNESLCKRTFQASALKILTFTRQDSRTVWSSLYKTCTEL